MLGERWMNSAKYSGLSLCHEHPYKKKHLLLTTQAWFPSWSLPKTSSKKKLLQCGTSGPCCLVGSKPWSETMKVEGFKGWIYQITLGWQHFLTVFFTWQHAKEMMPDFDLEFEVDRHYLCEVGHMSHKSRSLHRPRMNQHVFFFVDALLQSQHEPQVLLKSGGQSPAPWGTHRMSSSNIQQWMAVGPSSSKNGSLLRSNRPPISPQRLGLWTGKNPAFGTAFISLPGERMVLTLHLWQQRASLVWEA